MSWMKRAPGGPAPPPEQQFTAPQTYGNQQNAYPNYQGGVTGNNPQQQYWQAPPQQPQYNQQYGQVYQQVDYGSNANQYYQQQPQFNQNYPNQTYPNNPQQGYQQNYYQNQGAQQPNFAPNKSNDGWEDNWDWGWDDQSKNQKSQSASQQTAPQVTQPVFNNANVIEESFANTNTWNWAMEDKKEVKDHPAVNQGVQPPPVQNIEPAQDSNLVEGSLRETNTPQMASEDVRTLNDTEVVKERMPNLALGKRFHIDNLTPQWSIESQMSQDSSDGPQTQSEGTFRSEMQSRNSDKSNYSQHSLDEPYSQNPDWSQQSDEPTLADNVPNNHHDDCHNELANSLHEMSITNSENPAPDAVVKEPPAVSSQEIVTPSLPPPSSLPSNFPVSAPSSNPVQLPPATQPPPSVQPPPLSSSSSIPPPTSFPPSMQSQNPFKHAGAFSHKSATGKLPPAIPASSQPFPPPISSSSLTSPSVVNKVSQHNRAPVGFGANLETTPDNSERPDHPQVMPFRPMPVSQQVPENLEVAPKSDRNEYLQTAHLSSGDYGENTDFSRNIPPPGLRRMVVGQQESEYNQALNMSGDEPPPGLARMVPGQQNEAENSYNQPGDNYLDRHIDGQPMESGARPYRQAEGQHTPPRAPERRPVGLDRMVPGEPSNNEYPQYQPTSYASNEHRVVTGVDRDYPVPADAGPSDVREQNVDGSDYTAQTSRSNDLVADFPAPEEQQREVIMEGENLQDLSIVSSTDITYSREHTLDGADMNVIDVGADRKTDASDSLDHPATSSRRQSLNHVNTSGEDSERDRLFKNSPRRDKHRSSRDRDKEGRYSRGERKLERDGERRSGRGERWEGREGSPDARRARRSARHRRYDTDDTDYYSDRERERRRYREGSYASKPPRPDDKERRYDDRERGRRYNTIERDRHYDERDGPRRRERAERAERAERSERAERGERERHSERRYRDIDPMRKYGNLRRERDDDDRRRVVTFSGDAKPARGRRADEFGSPSRAGAESREPRTDDDRDRRRGDPYRRSRHARPYYDAHGYGGGYADPYQLQRAQYQYYEHLRHTDPAAYMLVYKQLMAGQPPPPPPPDFTAKVAGFMALREFQPEERGSVHSGRSSANDLKANDTFYAFRAAPGAGSLRGNASMRTDLSDRDLNTDASLNLQLEESTVRSERMTPFKYSTAHIKGSIASRNVVVVRPSYPVDGLPATVHVLSLGSALKAARDPDYRELAAYPGPLVKGVTHKKSVIEYCTAKARTAFKDGGRDPLGYVLLWELLALLLRQNGVVVGADIAELLMKNQREYEHPPPPRPAPLHDGSRRESSLSGSARDDAEPERAPPARDLSAQGLPPEELAGETKAPVDEAAALDRLRELLIYGNRQEAIEWAMSCNLWGHALQLSAHCERRTRAHVHARFVSALPHTDPLHTLYCALLHQLPPAATCAADPRWGDWRPHAAIVLSNAGDRAEHLSRTLGALGGALVARGLPHSAQFCLVAAGAQPEPHPLQPLTNGPVTSMPRLALLLADNKATTLQQLATNEAIFATEIYEYALSLHQEFVIEPLQTYKLILACRLCDVGDYERALAYVESAARTAMLRPERYSPQLFRAMAELAERLKYHDPALLEDPGSLALEADSGPGSPEHRQHQWLDDVKRVAEHTAHYHQAHQSQQASAAASQHGTPLHQHYDTQQQQYAWGDQTLQQQYPPQPAPTFDPASAAPVPPEETPDYAAQYYQPPPPPDPEPAPAPPQDHVTSYDPGYPDPAPQEYWQPDNHYGYNENASSGNAAGLDAPRPMITMPGGGGTARFHALDDDRPPSADQSERDTDTPKTSSKSEKKEETTNGSKKSGGWLGGFLGKLSLRAPNQMILPDDKNPTIVWDEQSKRWRNTDGDDDVASPPPPPRAAPLPAGLPRSSSPPLQSGPGAPGGNGGVAPPPVSNIFKMQKGRHIKKSYVDVLNPGGGAPRASPALPLPPAPPAAPTNFFVPQPQHQIIELPSSAASTPRASTPIPNLPLPESGIFDPSQVGEEEDFRSGI